MQNGFSRLYQFFVVLFNSKQNSFGFNCFYYLFYKLFAVLSRLEVVPLFSTSSNLNVHVMIIIFQQKRKKELRNPLKPFLKKKKKNYVTLYEIVDVDLAISLNILDSSQLTDLEFVYRIKIKTQILHVNSTHYTIYEVKKNFTKHFAGKWMMYILMH